MTSGHFDAGDDPISEEIEMTAAEWLVRRDRGFDERLQREFESWLTADARHPEAFARLEGTWQDLARVPAARVPIVSPATRTGRRLALCGALAAGLAMALVLWLERPPEGGPPALAEAVTPVGGYKEFALSDGTYVRLNTDTELVPAYTSAERRVILVRGEAHFDVVKQASRPFVVEAGGMDVRAVGTAFNVRLAAEAVEVLVTEGRVRVEREVAPAAMASTEDAAESGPVRPAPRLLELEAGEKTRIALGQPAVGPSVPVVARVATGEIARALAWRERRLEFDGEPLSEIVAEFNRYTTRPLTIVDTDLGARRFGGKFAAGDVDAFVATLERNFDVVAERREDRILLRRRGALP